MKQFALIFGLLLSVTTFSQEESNIKIKNNELSINLLDLVTSGAIEVQYELFMPQNQALQINATMFDNYGYY